MHVIIHHRRGRPPRPDRHDGTVASASLDDLVQGIVSCDWNDLGNNSLEIMVFTLRSVVFQWVCGMYMAYRNIDFILVFLIL